MKLKPLAVAIAILAVLSAATLWISRPPAPPPPDPRVGQSLADPAVIARAARFRLAGDGKTVLLIRQADGTWQVPDYFGLPADFSKLAGFVGDLTAAKIQRLVTVNPERISRLEFKDARIEVLDDAGKTLWSVGLGKTADTGGRFVRFGDESKAYLASLNASIDSDPKDWADASLLALKPDDVARVEIPFDPAGLLTISRPKKDAAWTADRTPAGETVSADKVSSLLGSLGSLRFTDTSDPADPQVAAAGRHLRKIVLTTFNGKAYAIALGRKPEEKKPAPQADKAAPANAPAPAPETIPAGPVYAFVASSDAKAPINGWMKKRAFQVDEYVFTGLPQKPGDLFEAAPAASVSKGSEKPK